MEGAKKKTNRAQTEPARCEDSDYLPHQIIDSQVADFAEAISVCEYFVAEQRPEDGLASLVKFLRLAPQYRKRMRQLGKARLTAGEPEFAALLFRAVLHQAKPKPESRDSASPPIETDTLANLDSPDDESDYEYIDQYSDAKRKARTYAAGHSPNTAEPKSTDFAERQIESGQDQNEQQPVPSVADDGVDIVPTQAHLLGSMSETDVDVEVDIDLSVFSPPEQLDLSIFEDVPDSPEELDWVDGDEVDTDLLETSPSETSLEDQDWEQYVEDALEFEEAPTRDDLVEVATTTHVTREQRCTQQAVELAQRFDWDDSGVLLLKEIFMQYSWNAAKAALIRQLERNISPTELRLAHQLRIFWSTTPEFSLSFGKYPHFVLSWPLAVEIIRSYRGEPDLAEIEHFLWNARDQWYSTNHLRNSFPAFRDYVKARISIFEADRICSNAMDWTDGMPIDAFDLDPVSGDLNNTPKINNLRSYDLLPTKPDDIADRIGITEWHEQVEAWATPQEYEVRLNLRGQDESD